MLEILIENRKQLFPSIEKGSIHVIEDAGNH